MGILSREPDTPATPEETAPEKYTGRPPPPMGPPDPYGDLLPPFRVPGDVPVPPEDAWRDIHHTGLYLELLDPSGEIVGRARWDAPRNANTAAPHQVRAVIGHEDGCTRVLATWDVPPY